MTEDNMIRGGVKTFDTKYGEIEDISVHMDDLLEMYKIHKEFNEGKEGDDRREWVHLTRKTSRKGSYYLQFNDYSLKNEGGGSRKKKATKKSAPKKTQEVDDTDDDLPF